MPAHVVHRTLLALMAVGVVGCAPARPTQSLPTHARPDEVGVVDNVGVVEQPDAVNQQTLTAPVVGRLYEPAHLTQAAPAVLFLGGSEGYGADLIAGSLSDLARHLAAQGYVTLQLCYFDCPERPPFLNRIPLEYVLSAVSYLRSLPEVAANSVNVAGWSRGGELALLVGSNSQDVRGVISVYGSPWAFGGLSGLGLSGTATGDCGWTLNDTCVPIGSPIPVQQIRGPVLLFHGQYDALWPMAYSELISAELDSAQHPHALTVFPNVGHTFGSLNCLIGSQRCRGFRSRLLSVDWDAAANVNATRVLFAQMLTLLRSEAAGTPLALPGVAGVPSDLAFQSQRSPQLTPTAEPGTLLLRAYTDSNYVTSVAAANGLGRGQTNQVVTPVPGDFADATLSIDARLVDPAADQFVVLTCRSQQDGSGYRFGILPASGRFSFTRWIGTLGTSGFTPVFESSSAIHTGAETNNLELRCQADHIEARINGTTVWAVSDYTFRTGGLSFAVSQLALVGSNRSPASSGTIQAQFSNLQVTQQ